MISKVDPTAGRGIAVYELKAALVGTVPPVWRRLRVPGNANLGWLHAVLQVAMGWTNSHLHHFLTARGRYLDPRFDEGLDSGMEEDGDETQTTLAEIAPEAGERFVYEYDFGDSWQHEIAVEKILPANEGPAKAARCLEGARACPPEDCGGPWGYDNLLKALKNPKHPDHKHLKQWIGGSFNAEVFDLEKANHWLSKLKWPHVTEAALRKVLMSRDDYRE